MPGTAIPRGRATRMNRREVGKYAVTYATTTTCFARFAAKVKFSKTLSPRRCLSENALVLYRSAALNRPTSCHPFSLVARYTVCESSRVNHTRHLSPTIITSYVARTRPFSERSAIALLPLVLPPPEVVQSRNPIDL